MTLLILAIAALMALGFQQWLHSKERQTLLDRIQAPDKVISERISDGPMLQAVHPDDDADYMDAHNIKWDPVEVPQ